MNSDFFGLSYDISILHIGTVFKFLIYIIKFMCDLKE